LGASGTYPSPPPPPPPPPDREPLTVAWIYFVAALLIFACFVICVCYRAAGRHPRRGNDERNYLASWCCCLLPRLRSDGHNERWRDGDAREAPPGVQPGVLTTGYDEGNCGSRR